MLVLVVTPDVVRARDLWHVLSGDNVVVHYCATFDAAQQRLRDTRYEALFADVRLGSYNGLHLVHLIAYQAVPTLCVLFSTHFDPGLVTEIRATGAFYEHADHVTAAAPSYLGSALPHAIGAGH